MNHRTRTATCLTALALLGSACSSGTSTVDKAAAATVPTPTTTVPPPTKEAPTTTTAPPAPAAPAAGSHSIMAPAADPTELAARLVAAERAITDAATPAADLAAWGHAQQITYRQLVQRAEWVDQVRGALPDDLRATFDRNLSAGQKLRAMLKEPKATLPRWRIVTPPPADELLGHYQAAEAEFGVPWQYLAAINLVETRMGRIRGLSSAGAQGPMQFMPATWAAYGEGDVNDHGDAIRGAARYLKRNGAPGDMRNALWNYNHDHRYVDAVIAYAEGMASSPAVFRAYWGWQVYYVMVDGDAWLPEGWEHPEGSNA